MRKQDRVLQIREFIAQAMQHEAREHTLERYLESKRSTLHRVIRLPEAEATQSLMNFLTDYIRHVPDMIDALRGLTQGAGIVDVTEQFIEIMEDYFIQPPESLIAESHQGLHALIDEAYLAHRLIEEVNDRMMMLSGIPFAPMDMTLSNLIVHEILGEDFANELDLAVHYSVESLFDPDALRSNRAFLTYVEQRKQSGWGIDLDLWPCLAGDASISLELNGHEVHTLH